MSIAYERCGRLELSAVFDALKRELFVAARGRGTRLNARPIHVSATPSLDRALLATGFPCDRRERRDFYFTFWEAFHDTHAGTAAQGLTRVISGRSGRDADRRWCGGRVNNLDGAALSRRAQDPREQSQAAWPDARDDREGVAGGGSARSREPPRPITRPSFSSTSHQDPLAAAVAESRSRTDHVVS